MNHEHQISLVIPCFREGKILHQMVNAILDVIRPIAVKPEIILIDDGSDDDTWETITTLSAEHGVIRGLRLSRNFGKEAALAAGLDHASGDAVIVMDADLQHPPEYLPAMISAWRDEGFHIVEAVRRRREGDTIINKVSASAFYFILSSLSGYDFRGASDFKLLDRHVIDAWKRMPERQVFFRGMTAWLGFRRKQFDIVTARRPKGSTRWSVYSLFRLALTALTAFSSFPLHIVTGIGMVFVFFSVLLGLHTLNMKLSGQAVEGFTTVILIVLITGSALMISLGIIGEYLSRIYEEIKGRPRYVLVETTNLSRNSVSPP